MRDFVIAFVAGLALILCFAVRVAFAEVYALQSRASALEREHALHHPECPDIVDEHPLKPTRR